MTGVHPAVRRAAAACALALALAGGRAAPADVLVLESGKEARGAAFRAGEEVRLNPYGCTAPEMTLGVRVFRARDVRRIDPDEDAPWIVSRLDALLEAPAAEAQAGLLELFGLARRRAYRDLARRLAEEALARGATDAEALKSVGGAARFAERRRGDPRLDPALAERVGALLLLERGSARGREAARLAAEEGLLWPAPVLERLAAALEEPVGEVEERALAWREAETPAGTYSLRVPADAYPLHPRPLVLALHGGARIARGQGPPGLGGSGRDLLRLLGEGAERLGWFLVCPTALEAPWDTPANRAFVEAVLTEVTGRYAIDLARLHVVGLGEGGSGAYALASAWPERFASVGAMGAPPAPNAQSILSRRVGLWIGHGEDDAVWPVAPVRRVAERLLEGGADFVYCELPKEGHGLPAAAERDYYRYVEGRRNPRARDAWPDPSLLRPVTALELAGRGDPAGALGAGLPAEASEERLWEALRAGGRAADPAAERLLLRRPEGLVERTLALVRDARAPAGARAFGAWLLGELGDRSAAPVLGDALRATDDPLLTRRLARALGRLRVPESREDLRAALLGLSARHQRARFPGGRVPFQAHQQASLGCAALVEALARVARAEDVVEDVEQAVVLGLLRDARAVDARAGPGGDPGGLRRDLARSVARAYRTLGAEPTLLEMLRSVLRKDPAALAAVAEGYREGVR